MEHHHAINGKTHYKWQFSIAILNYQRVGCDSFWDTCIDNQSLAFRHVHCSQEMIIRCRRKEVQSTSHHAWESCIIKRAPQKSPKNRLPRFYLIYPALIWCWTSSKPPCQNFEGDLWQIHDLYGSVSFPFWQHQTSLLQWSNSDQLL